MGHNKNKKQKTKNKKQKTKRFGVGYLVFLQVQG
jgi:hypothetical protein